MVIAADGIHSVARRSIVDDQPVSSAYVAYRGAVPIELAAENDIDPSAVQVYVGPGCHFVQYALRAGEMFNQVAVFESPKAIAGKDDWGTPDELDAAFEGTCNEVQKGLPLMWRDRWWRMFDRDPIMNWLNGRVALLGDSAHPPLQYMAQGAIMAIEDGWVLAQQGLRRHPSTHFLVGAPPGAHQRHNSGVIEAIEVELTREAAALLAVAADPVRLTLLSRLAASGTRCVCDLQLDPPIPANLLSYHLRALRDAGLVTTARRGRWVDYTLAEDALERLHAALPAAAPAAARCPSCR